MYSKKFKILLPFLLFVLITSKVNAANYYWQGNSGNWTDITHWFDSPSGGTQYLVVPGVSDDVFFGASSFTLPGQVITLAGGSGVQIANLSWSGVTNNPTFVLNTDLEIYGSLTFVSGMSFVNTAVLYFNGSGTNSITTAGKNLGEFRMVTTADTDIYNLMDDLYFADVRFHVGTFNTNNHSLFQNSGSITRIESTGVGLNINWGSSNILFSNILCDAGSFGTINPGTSTITVQGDYIHAYYTSNTMPFYNLTLSGNSNQYCDIVAVIDVTNKLTNSNNLIQISSEGNTSTAQDVVFTVPTTLLLEATTTFEITNSFTNTATGCNNNITNIFSMSLVSTAKLKKTSGTLTLSNCAIQGIEAMGGATFNATGLDLGFNSGWTFTAPGATQNFYWFGGNGNVNDVTHWSLSNGSYNNPSSCLPTINDNVFFNEAGGTVNFNTTFACRNMDFSGGTMSTAEPVSNITKYIMVNGSLTLKAGMTWGLTQDIFFVSSSATASITTNNVTLNNVVSIRGSGTYTNADDFTSNSMIKYYAGGWNTNSRYITCLGLLSDQTESRTWTLGSSTIRMYNSDFQNTINTNNLTLNAGTSELRFEVFNAGQIVSNNGVLLINGPPVNFYDINFAFPAGGSASDMSFNGGTQNFHDVSFAGNTYLHNGDMNLHNLVLLSGITLTMDKTGTHTFTGGIITPSGCGTIITLKGTGGGTQVNFVSALPITITNCSVQDIRTSGGGVFTANGSINNGNNTGWIFTPPAAGQNYYWVGGTGNWSDCTHWSLTSGVANNPSCCIPGLADNVYFDANSFSASGQTVYQDVDAYFFDMDWAGSAARNPIFETVGFPNIYAFGSLYLNNTITVSNWWGSLYFESTGTVNINLFNKSFYNHWNQKAYFKRGGIKNLLSNLSIASVFVNGGTLTTNGNTVQTDRFIIDDTDAPITLNLGSSYIDIYYEWDLNDANGDVTINPGTSIISPTWLYTRSPNTLTYYNIYLHENVQGWDKTLRAWQAPITAHKLKMLNCDLDYISGDNTFDSLWLAPATVNTFDQNSIQYINNKLIAKGNPCYRITIKSGNDCCTAKIHKTNATDSVIVEYATLRAMEGTGGAQFVASSFSIDNTLNVNWNFVNLGSQNYGLGARTQTIACASFPYTLSADGFNGGISWLWTSDNSVLFSDQFNRANNTSLGISWTERYNSADYEIVSNKLQLTSNDFDVTTAYTTSGIVSPDYGVESVINFPTLNPIYAGIVGRLSTFGGFDYDGYMMYAEPSLQSVFVYKRISGAWTQLGSYATTILAGNSYSMGLDMAGTTINAYWNGTQVISVTDGDITAAGAAGVTTGTGYNETGVTWDNFTINSSGRTSSSIVVSDTGTYSVRVDLGGSCFAFDTVTLAKTNCPTPLPIELINFSSSCSGNKVILKWESASEINHQFYTLKKSSDAINWQTIATIQGASDSYDTKQYDYTDDIETNSDVTYYQLSQTDNDGITTVFKTLAENCNDTFKELKITGNNLTSNTSPLMIITPYEGEHLITLYDALGKTVFSESKLLNKGQNLYIKKFMLISAGVYFMSVEKNTNSTSTKLIITND